MKKKQKTDSFIKLFEDERQVYLNNITSNPANMLWNIAELYEKAAGVPPCQELKDMAEQLRGLYNEEERAKLPGVAFFFDPSVRLWQIGRAHV